MRAKAVRLIEPSRIEGLRQFVREIEGACKRHGFIFDTGDEPIRIQDRRREDTPANEGWPWVAEIRAAQSGRLRLRFEIICRSDGFEQDYDGVVMARKAGVPW